MSETRTFLLGAADGTLVPQNIVASLDHIPVVIGHQVYVAEVKVDVLFQHLILAIDLLRNGLSDGIKLSLVLREILNERVVCTFIAMNTLGVCGII